MNENDPVEVEPTEEVENEPTETVEVEPTEAIEVEATETDETIGLITPDDVYTVEVSAAPDVLALYFVALGGVIVAGAIVHLILHYVGRYRT